MTTTRIICLLVTLLGISLAENEEKQLFNSAVDAQTLRDAISSGSTETIVDILGRRKLATRLDIANEYRKQFTLNLIDDLSNHLSGDLWDLINAMMKPRPEYYADELFRAIDGLGTDEAILNEILCTLSNGEIKEVRRAYHQARGVYLEEDIIGDTSGYYLELLVDITRTEREEHMELDPAAAKADAEALYSTTQDDRWAVYSEIFVKRSYGQLDLIFQEYEILAGHGIETGVNDNFSGDVHNGLSTIVASVKNKPKFFASRVYDSVDGWGTNELEMDRVIVTRAEVDIEDVKREYADEYGESLRDAIDGDTSGEYRRCLLMLIGE